MNKLAIPAILAATVLVAGMFAFMPVQKASTIHSSTTRNTTVFNLSGITLAATSYVMLYDGAGTGRSANIEVNISTAALAAGLVIERIAPGASVWSVVPVAAFPITAGSAALAQGHADTTALALRIANPTGAPVAVGAAPAGLITVTIVGPA